MKNKLLIVSPVIIGMVAVLFFQNQAQVKLRGDNELLQDQIELLQQQIARLKTDNANLSNRLAGANNAPSLPNDQFNELLKLRGEITQLRNEANDATGAAAKSLVARVNKLKQRLADTPNASIPEFQFLTEQDWLNAASGNLDTDADYRHALASLRSAAENSFAPLLQTALSQYMQANNGQFPTDISQLQSYFTSPVDDAILQRWEIAPASTVPNVGMGDTMITEKAAVDDVVDTRIVVGPSGYGSTEFLSSEIGNTLKPVYEAYASANPNGLPIGLNQQNSGPSILLPYATTPEQQAAVQKLIEQKALENALTK
jgi:hypothetical protein